MSLFIDRNELINIIDNGHIKAYQTTGIALKDGDLVFVQGFPLNPNLISNKDVINAIYDFDEILGHNYNKVENQIKALNKKYKIDMDLDKYSIIDIVDVMKYLGEVILNIAYPKFPNAKKCNDTYFDPTLAACFYWPIEDVIDKLNQNDIHMSWLIFDEVDSNINKLPNTQHYRDILNYLRSIKNLDEYDFNNW